MVEIATSTIKILIIVIPFTFTQNPYNKKYCYYPHFTDKETTPYIPQRIPLPEFKCSGHTHIN
jgi:hypothetical protein